MTTNEATTRYMIPWYPDYAVTREGKVYSRRNWRGYGERELRPIRDEDGYYIVRITHGGKRWKVRVHRLVAAMFLPPRPTPTHELRHLDGDNTNNLVANLAWGTRKENADDREAHGRTSRGLRHSEAIRTGRARKAVLV